jgi:EAL domain-containing protein (putative c-di-GMP-specific phosphodiesterase class I)
MDGTPPARGGEPATTWFMRLPRIDSSPDVSEPGPGPHKKCVLLLDDDLSILKTYSRVLENAGFTVVRRSSGVDVGRVLSHGNFHAVVSDISMPGVDGTEVLRMVREHDPDLPVILMTGVGDLRSAVKAVELKAMRYLLKPIDRALLVATVDSAVQQREAAAHRRRALEAVDRAASQERDLATRFARALASMYLVHQPIVSWGQRSVFGHEALVRTAEPSLADPTRLIAVADRLGRLGDLSRAIRRAAADRLRATPAGALAFVNLHPLDLTDDDLYSPDAPLSAVASRVVLEVTECASLEQTGDLLERLQELRRMGFRIALDDLGAGYASLSAFVHLSPHAVKLDKSLTRGVETDSTRRKLIASMCVLCRELDILVVGEGVETAAQRDALVALGCDLLQGFLFAAPAAEYPPVAW